jgi:tRNA/rRNA methyltransferase
VQNAQPLKNIRVVLTQPSHPGNIGATARAMKTMGLADLVLVTPKTFPHPDALARASGAADVLAAARVVATLDEALAGCVLAVAVSARKRELRHETVTVREAAPRAIESALAGPVALVFGNETSGLSRDEAARCRFLAMIPANPDYPSLNLAAAVQVFCYELRMAAGGALPAMREEFVPASHEDVEGMLAHAEQALLAIGFLDPANPKRLLPRLRRLAARAHLEREEVNILRGMLQAAQKWTRGT